MWISPQQLQLVGEQEMLIRKFSREVACCFDLAVASGQRSTDKMTFREPRPLIIIASQ